MDQNTSNGPELHLGVPRGGHNSPGRAWASWHTPVGAPPLEAPPGASLPHLMSFGPKNPQEVLLRWTPFGIDFLQSKKQAKNIN